MKFLQKRIEWIDVLKGVLILFVLLSHSNPPYMYERFYTPFFLTMFFWASGYTYNDNNCSFCFFVKRKIFHLIIPLLSLGGIKMIVACIVKHDSLYERLVGLLMQISCKNDDLWFVSCMFSTSILFYIVIKLSNKVTNKWFLLMLGLVFMFIGYILIFFKIRLPWEFELACIMLFYMLIGKLMRQYLDYFELNMKKIVMFLGVIYLLLCFFKNDTNIHQECFECPLLFFVQSVLAILPMIFISKKASSYNVLRKLLVWAGKNTLFLYAFEGYSISLFYFAIGKLGYSNKSILSLACVVFILLTLAIPILLVNKYIPVIVGKNRL